MEARGALAFAAKLGAAVLFVLGVVTGVRLCLLYWSAPGDASLGAGATTFGGQGSEASEAEFSLFQRGASAIKRGEDDGAAHLFRSCLADEAASAIDTAACKAGLGELLLTGSASGDLAANSSLALSYLEEAAAAGNADGQFLLSIVHSSTHRPGADLQRKEALSVLHLYAASTAGHPGALMAMGYRHMHGYGVPQSCSAAALNYIDVAKEIASVYSEGMPRAVELIRLNLDQRDRKVISSSHMNLYIQVATGGDTTVAAAIGKRYLLGIEGFRQDYAKARHYLKLAADRSHAPSLALLGYMHSLGLGVPQDLDTAYAFFVAAASRGDSLGHNGLGYIYFKGTQVQQKNHRLAFRHFNESAYGGASDGMFNLASMYLTGTGVDQSFNKAVIFYTKALDHGHTPAAYSLAVMHLNGIGTVRDCDIAVELLKKVCERGEWVSSKLSDANEYCDTHPDRAALLFLKLAEAGHEVAQMNAAHLFDGGQTSLLTPSMHTLSGAEHTGTHDEQEQQGQDTAARHRWAMAQRLYELSAEQGSASSELRLGDYAYNGWGLSAAFAESRQDMVEIVQDEVPGADNVTVRSLYTRSRVVVEQQAVDYESALARYRKTAEMAVTGEWMQGFVARGSFNLGLMHQLGLGVHQDLQSARQHFQRCKEVDPDPNGLQMPVTLALLALHAHALYTRLPKSDLLLSRLSGDFRVHTTVVKLAALAVLVALRAHLSSRAARAALRRRTDARVRNLPEGAPHSLPPASGGDGGAGDLGG